MQKSENHRNIGRPLGEVSAEDLARSARARREATNRFGMLFREMQLETWRAMIEREGSDEGLVVQIQQSK